MNTLPLTSAVYPRGGAPKLGACFRSPWPDVALVPCPWPPQANAPNVVVITIDTLRADHLGCYGDGTIATPNLDALARSAARFTNAFTPVPITLPAHTALFTGSFPMATGVHDFSGNKVPASAVTLAKVLQ